MYKLKNIVDITGFKQKRVISDLINKGIYSENKDYSYSQKDLSAVYDIFNKLENSTWHHEIKPNKEYKIIELFAGCGGLAIGMEKAGFKSELLNEWDKHACKTLRYNRPHWNVIEGDVSKISFVSYKDKVDVVSGGFPCQAFSHIGKRLGFEDTRGTLFFEFARAVKEVNPKIFIAENVTGLLTHDNGNTLKTITDVIKNDLGYILIKPLVLNAMFFGVPQKRERLFLIGVRKDIFENIVFEEPELYNRVVSVKDALLKGELYNSDVPLSAGYIYNKRKKEIMDMVPQGGYWKNLPLEIQKEYMQKSFFSGGGKTGMAKRLDMELPSLTLTCSPSQKQTERCHPLETRPLQIREYARIQTFPDDWNIQGALSYQYKQIGNAVPVNLAYSMGRCLIKMLNQIK